MNKQDLIKHLAAHADVTNKQAEAVLNALTTEAARNAVIEALSGVQALSAAPAVPAGWKAVPVNPTPEMWKAAKSVPDPNPPYPPHYGLVWDAMLAASPTPTAEQPVDPDGEAFRKAARLGLTLRFYGSCAQSSMPGTPSAYVVTHGGDRADAMREAVEQAAAIIASGGEAPPATLAPPAEQPSDQGDAGNHREALRAVLPNLPDTNPLTLFAAGIRYAQSVQAAPKAAPGEREQAAQRLREFAGISQDDLTDPLHPRYIAGYKAGHAAGRKRAAPQQEAQEPCGWTTGITWRPNTRLQSEQVIKITRDTQPKYGYTTPIYTAPQPAPAPLSDDVSQKTWALLDELAKLRGANRDEEDWDTLNKRDDELCAALAAQGGK